MPFNQPYKNDFTAGDLVYGVAPARKNLILKLGNDIWNAGVPATVDQYRKKAMDNLSKKNRKTWKGFLQENESHPKYGRYMQTIRSHNNDEEAFAEFSKNEKQINSIWRAKSKFGMEWTIKNQQGGHIHFMLDTIDMGAVVTKTHEFISPDDKSILACDRPRGKAPDSDKERTITHSELRWIYRNRNNPLVQARVQFWMTIGNQLITCAPPWNNENADTIMPSGKTLTWKQAWCVYHPTRERNQF